MCSVLAEMNSTHLEVKGQRSRSPRDGRMITNYLFKMYLSGLLVDGSPS